MKKGKKELYRDGETTDWNAQRLPIVSYFLLLLSGVEGKVSTGLI